MHATLTEFVQQRDGDLEMLERSVRGDAGSGWGAREDAGVVADAGFAAVEDLGDDFELATAAKKLQVADSATDAAPEKSERQQIQGENHFWTAVVDLTFEPTAQALDHLRGKGE